MRRQWLNGPSEVLPLLMNAGGTVVHRGVVQLAGTGPLPFAPAVFSFGWLAYSLMALTMALGGGRLLLPPDGPSTFVNVKTRASCRNESWALFRLLHDEEHATAQQT